MFPGTFGEQDARVQDSAIARHHAVHFRGLTIAQLCSRDFCLASQDSARYYMFSSGASVLGRREINEGVGVDWHGVGRVIPSEIARK